jgi:HEAT repeat protein
MHFSPALEAALADNDAQVRASATKALGKVGRVEARLALQKMAATDPHSYNRQMASDAIEAICQRTASRAEKRRQAAVTAMDRLVDVRRPPEERQQAKESLVRISDELLIPALDQALQESKNDRVRVDIVEILASLPPSNKSQTTLLGYIHHVSPSVRRRAIIAVGDVGDEKAIYYLNEVAREGDEPGQLLTLEDAQLAREAVQKIREREG